MNDKHLDEVSRIRINAANTTYFNLIKTTQIT